MRAIWGSGGSAQEEKGLSDEVMGGSFGGEQPELSNLAKLDFGCLLHYCRTIFLEVYLAG